MAMLNEGEGSQEEPAAEQPELPAPPGTTYIQISQPEREAIDRVSTFSSTV